MSKLKLPKNPYKGIKIHCTKCKSDNPKSKSDCEHRLVYRVRVHVPNSLGGKKIKSKVLKSENYKGAVLEAIEFEKILESNKFKDDTAKPKKNDINLFQAIINYEVYLRGGHYLVQFQKEITVDYANECLRYMFMFSDSLKENKISLNTLMISAINDNHVAIFYKYLNTKNHSPKYFNKIISTAKSFFKYLIDIEKLKCDNPFIGVITKIVPKKEKEVLTKEEFLKIIGCISPENGVRKVGKENKNFYKTYLVDGIYIGLLTGLRRNELVSLKWNDLSRTIKGNLFFNVLDKKYFNQTGKEKFKPTPVTPDLEDYLKTMGYPNINDDDYVLHPNRTEKSKTIVDALSKGFSHFRDIAEIEKAVDFKNLRKTHLTWMNIALGKDMVFISGHADMKVLETHYLDERTIKLIDDMAVNFRVFGT